MRVLVTGAAGYIGSHTILELLEAGHEVICIDNFNNSVADSNGQAISLLRVSELTGKSVQFYNVDLCDEAALENVFRTENFNCVIHIAAYKAVAESMADPFKYYTNNVGATMNLIKMCKKHDVRNFIFSSSCSVYGTSEELPFLESSKVGHNLANPYGQSKYMSEEILRGVAKTTGEEWNIIVLRYFNVVGAHPSGRIGEDPRGIPNNLMPFVSQVAVGRRPFLTIFGDQWNTTDGSCIRDYIHVVDLALGHLKALERIEKEGNIGTELYNLGTGNGFSVKEMVAAFEKASGIKVKTKIGPPRQGDVASMYCDPSLAQEKLGWKAGLGLDDMCRDLWKWQSSNPNGYAEEIVPQSKTLEKKSHEDAQLITAARIKA